MPGAALETLVGRCARRAGRCVARPATRRGARQPFWSKWRSKKLPGAALGVLVGLTVTVGATLDDPISRCARRAGRGGAGPAARRGTRHPGWALRL